MAVPTERVEVRPVGAGALLSEFGSKGLDYFNKRLYYKPEQDITFTKRYMKQVGTTTAAANSKRLIFQLEGRSR
jgi:hypothetical protein